MSVHLKAPLTAVAVACSNLEPVCVFVCVSVCICVALSTAVAGACSRHKPQCVCVHTCGSFDCGCCCLQQSPARVCAHLHLWGALGLPPHASCCSSQCAARLGAVGSLGRGHPWRAVWTYSVLGSFRCVCSCSLLIIKGIQTFICSL